MISTPFVNRQRLLIDGQPGVRESENVITQPGRGVALRPADTGWTGLVWGAVCKKDPSPQECEGASLGTPARCLPVVTPGADAIRCDQPWVMGACPWVLCPTLLRPRKCHTNCTEERGEQRAAELLGHGDRERLRSRGWCEPQAAPAMAPTPALRTRCTGTAPFALFLNIISRKPSLPRSPEQRQ